MLAFGTTCTWLCHNVGQWLQTKRPRLRNCLRDGSVYASVYPPHWSMEIDCFSQIINSITVYYPLSKDGFYIRLDRYQSLKSIEFVRIKVNAADIDCLREILCQVEIIKFNECEINVKPFEVIFSACENLEYLSVIGKMGKKPSKIIGTSNDWLRKKYPKLDHFELKYKSFKVKRIKELTQYFSINSNIRSFSTDEYCVLKNFDYLMETKNRFDVFSITIRIDSITYLRKCFQLLNQLYENKLYDQ